MDDKDRLILLAMEEHGGHFAAALAGAAFRADQKNFDRLKAAFPDIWAEYAWVVDHTKRPTVMP